MACLVLVCHHHYTVHPFYPSLSLVFCQHGLAKWRKAWAWMHWLTAKAKEMGSLDGKGGCILGHSSCNTCDGAQQRNQNSCCCHCWEYPNKSHPHCQVSTHPSIRVSLINSSPSFNITVISICTYMNIGDGNLAWKCFSISSYVCEIWCNAGSLL